MVETLKEYARQDAAKYCRLLALKDVILAILKKEDVYLEDNHIAMFHARDFLLVRNKID